MKEKLILAAVAIGGGCAILLLAALVAKYVGPLIGLPPY